MLFRRERKEVPLLNTTSTADISFMLLILFLVTTSMDIDKGLTRQLPPIDSTEEQQPTEVREGLVMKIHISGDNHVDCNGESVSVGSLRQRIVSHVQQQGREHLLQLQTDREAAYDTYFQVQNAIVAAYSQLRNQAAVRRYGHAFVQCSDEQQKHLREEIPQRVSEVYLFEGGAVE